jgi:chromosome segregation ATPase
MSNLLWKVFLRPQFEALTQRLDTLLARTYDMDRELHNHVHGLNRRLDGLNRHLASIEERLTEIDMRTTELHRQTGEIVATRWDEAAMGRRIAALEDHLTRNGGSSSASSVKTPSNG